jgi:glycosyltransferase involved in cell wall biosynthesis/peptidoglycan/xylan/chitin deacetylase (PgdA/CDA1 family)
VAAPVEQPDRNGHGLRILALSPSLEHGGSERVAIALAAGLEARGHTVLLAYGAARDLAPAAEAAGVETAYVTPTPLSRSTLPAWSRSLRAVVRSFAPDVIHAHSVTAALAARLAAPRTPVAVTIHGIAGENERTAALSLRLAGVTVSAVSERSADGINRQPLGPVVTVLPNGVDLERLADDAAAPVDAARAGDPAVVCVARLVPEKGVDVAVAAFPAVLAAEPGARLTLIGGGPEAPAIAAQVDALGIGAAVRMLGAVANAAPYVAAADVVVLPSRREGLPMIALEALGLARAVVATAVGGTPSVVDDPGTGWLVPADDPARLAAAIVTAAAEPQERARRGQAGRDLVRARYAAAASLDQVEALLEPLATRSRLTLAPRPYYAAKAVHQRVRRSFGATLDWSGLRILTYHRVADGDELGVAPDRFRAQMAWLAASDVEPVALADGLRRIDAADAGRMVALTFDDGYHDTLSEAAPTIERYGIPATVYVATRVIDGAVGLHCYRDLPAMLSWDELQALRATGGWDVGSHTRHHLSLPQLSDYRARDEIVGARAELEERLGAAVTSFCYPAGRFGQRELALVAEAGFTNATSCEPGVNDGAAPRLALRRTAIDRRDHLADFAAKIAGRLDSPSSLRTALHARRSAP